MNTPTRILVADDHEMIRKGLCALLQAQPGWEVCGEAVDGAEAVELARTQAPDVVIMDLTMPRLHGLEATRQIRKMLPRCEVLILTMHASEQLMLEVLAAGARGYVVKSDAGSLIVAAVEALRRHKPFFTPELSGALIESYLEPGGRTLRDGEGGTLTPRESVIVQLIAEGRSSKEIAAALEISDKTVETHRANLMRKLGIHSVSEIVRYAIRNKLVDP